MEKRSLLNGNTWCPQGMLLMYMEVTDVINLKGVDSSLVFIFLFIYFFFYKLDLFIYFLSKQWQTSLVFKNKN